LVRSHVVGGRRRGGGGLTQRVQRGRRLGDGVGARATLVRAVVAAPGDERRRLRRRSFPPLQCSLGQLGFVGGVCGGAGEPRTTSRGPHLLYIALCDGGPPTMDRLGAPDQGA